MKSIHELVWGLLKIGLASVGLLYAVEVIASYAKCGEHDCPEFDPAHIVDSIERLAVWVGVISIRVSVRMCRPLLGVLTEASADVGEWALARHPVRASLPGRER